MKQLRHLEHSQRQEWAAERIAASWRLVEPIARVSLFTGNLAAKLFGDRAVRAILNAARTVVSRDLLPSWVESVPTPVRSRLPRTKEEGAVAIYFPACINRIFGGSRISRRKRSLPETFVAASERAGNPLFIPPDVVGNRCATVRHSKGYNAGNILMASRVVESMWRRICTSARIALVKLGWNMQHALPMSLLYMRSKS